MHPTDSNWPGLRPFVDTRLLNRSASKKNKANSGKAGGSAHYSVPSPEGRGPALVSQSDLFQRCKVEVDDQATRYERGGRSSQKEWDSRTDRDRDYQRERDGGNHTGALDSGNKNRFHGGYTKNRSISPARTYVKKYNKTGSDSSKKLTELDNKSKVCERRRTVASTLKTQQGATGKRSEDAPSNEIKRMAAVPNAALKTSVDSKDDFSSSSLQNAKPWLISSFVPTIPNKDDAPTPTLAVVSDERRRAERLVGLFRGLAK